MKQLLRFIVCILVCEGVGIVGLLFTSSAIRTWYATLNRPEFAPPNWVFGPVWTILYFLMGVSLFLVWGKRKTKLKWFWIQLVLNMLWSFIFFGLKNPFFAFIELVILWIAIALTIRDFQKVDKIAARLQYPYILWVTFAGVLNLSIVVLNK